MTVVQKFKVAMGLNRIWNDAVKEAAVGTKHILQSKTIWFNVAAGLFLLLQANGAFASIPEPYVALVDVIGNIILRFQTKQPLSVTGA